MRRRNSRLLFSGVLVDSVTRPFKLVSLKTITAEVLGGTRFNSTTHASATSDRAPERVGSTSRRSVARFDRDAPHRRSLRLLDTNAPSPTRQKIPAAK